MNKEIRDDFALRRQKRGEGHIRVDRIGDQARQPFANALSLERKNSSVETLDRHGRDMGRRDIMHNPLETAFQSIVQTG